MTSCLAVPSSTVNLSATDVTDADLAQLKAFTHIQELGLFNTKVDDAGLASLKGLPLERLILSETKVTGGVWNNSRA